MHMGVRGGVAQSGGASSPGATQAEARLLVVEDDPNILELLSASLRFAGFAVDAATTGAEAVTAGREAKPDLIVLDVMLPDYDGFEVIKRLRESGVRVPVVFLTARDGDRGQDARADRSAATTTSPSRSASRSSPPASARCCAAPPVTRAPTGSTFADLELDEETHEVVRAGQTVSLSPTEFKLLRYLMLNAGRVLSKAQILDHVWNYDFRGDDSIVESYISYLRRKVDIAEPRLIHTLRGVGYVLRLPV